MTTRLRVLFSFCFVSFLSLNVFGVTTDLIISEYVEGSSLNKYIEIYNGTGAAVDLSDYELRLYVNGSTSPNSNALSGILPDGDVVVYSNSSASEYSGATTDNSSINFSGDDAFALAKNGVNIDVLGEIGVRSNYAKDVTLRRKSTICSPTTTYNSAEFDQFAQNDVSGLGAHTSSCAPQDTEVKFAASTYSISEDGGSIDICVAIENPSSSAATSVEVALTTGNAADLDNYTTQTVTFPNGSSANQCVTVNITDNANCTGLDTDYTFTLQNVSGGLNSTIESPNTTVLTVSDDDQLPGGSEVLFIADFDGGTPSWNYSTDVPFFDNGSDGFYGITSTLAGIDFGDISGNFIGVDDLDDEGDNGTSGFATLTFDNVNISGKTGVVLSFDYEVQSWDNDDDMFYTVVIDGVDQTEVFEVNGPESSGKHVSVTIPDGSSSVGLRVRFKQNGADHAGFDNFKVVGDAPGGCPEPEINITSNPTDMNEGNGSANTQNVTVEITNATVDDVVVDLTPQIGGQEGVRYNITPATITLNETNTSADFTITSIPNCTDESNAFVILNLDKISGTATTGASNSKSFFFNDDDDVASAITGNTNVCANQAETYSITNFAGYNYSWDGDGGTVATASSNTTDITFPSGGTYNISVTQTSTDGSCVTSASKSVFVSAESVGGTASNDGAAICETDGTIGLSLAGHTGNIQWEFEKDGGGYTNISGATTANETFTHTGPGTYNFRAVVTSGVCDPVNSTVTTVTVQEDVVSGTASIDETTICNTDNNFELTLAGQTGTIQWQVSTDGGSTFNDISGATVSPYTYTHGGVGIYHFRAVVTSGVCGNATSNEVVGTVETESVAGTASVNTTEVCNDNSTAVNLSLAGFIGTIQWQFQIDGAGYNNIAGATSNNESYTPTIDGVHEFKAVVTNGVCAAAESNVVTVTVQERPTIGFASATSTITEANCASVNGTIEVSLSSAASALCPVEVRV